MKAKLTLEFSAGITGIIISIKKVRLLRVGLLYPLLTVAARIGI
jgi:hypothetical protein